MVAGIAVDSGEVIHLEGFFIRKDEIDTQRIQFYLPESLPQTKTGLGKGVVHIIPFQFQKRIGERRIVEIAGYYTGIRRSVHAGPDGLYLALLADESGINPPQKAFCPALQLVRRKRRELVHLIGRNAERLQMHAIHPHDPFTRKQNIGIDGIVLCPLEIERPPPHNGIPGENSVPEPAMVLYIRVFQFGKAYLPGSIFLETNDIGCVFYDLAAYLFRRIVAFALFVAETVHVIADDTERIGAVGLAGGTYREKMAELPYPHQQCKNRIEDEYIQPYGPEYYEENIDDDQKRHHKSYRRNIRQRLG